MTVSHTCATCQTTLEIEDQYAGRWANCPNCQAAFVVPGAPDARFEPIAAQSIERPGPALETGNPYQSPADETFRSVTTNWALLETPLASRGTRWLGAVVDNALFQTFLPLAIGVMAWWTASFLLSRYRVKPDFDFDGDEFAFSTGMIAFAAALLVVLIIQAILVTRRGQSLGKMLLKTQLVDAQTGQLPGFVRGVLVRMIVPLGIRIIPVGNLFLLMDAIFIFREDRRRVVDHLARTIVISLRDQPPRRAT